MRPATKHVHPRRAAAFSLLEVLLATIILGLGLIMVASVFPVGANWGRQASEETIATNLAWNAVSIVRTHYANGGFSPSVAPTDPNDAYYSAGVWKISAGAILTVRPPPTGQRVYCLPNFGTKVPVSERTYAVGSGTPFPVPVARCAEAHYFWTALIRVPEDNSATATLYILVFRRGNREATFSAAGYSSPPLPPGVGAVELADCRDAGNEKISGVPFTPSVIMGTWQKGTLTSSQVVGAWPQIGSFGIGATTGTIFRSVVGGAAFDQATPSSMLQNQAVPTDSVGEKIISATPADSTGDNPLIFIYQTQISF